MSAVRGNLLTLVFFYVVATPGPVACAQDGSSDEALAKVAGILRSHCFDCHGQDPRKIKGKLNVFDHGQMLDRDRGLVIPKKPDESALIERVEKDEMPPGKRVRLSPEEKKVLRGWVAMGAPPLPAPKIVQERPDEAAQAKEVLRAHCLECHGGTRTNGGVRILDDAALLEKKKVVPGRPDESPLLRLVTASDDSVMPPSERPRLSGQDVETIRRWIAAGAAPFPQDAALPQEAAKDEAFKDVVGVNYVLKQILAHIRAVPLEERRFIRYFSINHVLYSGATADELDLQRQALFKAINHLSWEKTLVKPEAVDAPVNSIYAVDLRRLGWHRQLYRRLQGGKADSLSPLNLFDLALLEYPYGIYYEASPTFNRLVEEFLVPAGQVTPVPYVRADWFVSVVTQPPLYEDFLQLPDDVGKLETRLNIKANPVAADSQARRAGVAVSGVSRNNRVVERYPIETGAYWKSYDFRTSKGPENIFRDPINLYPSGGEMIFNLPNGLQAYYVATAQGARLEAAPTDIVTDKFASDKVVRNGLACMRCHDQGTKAFVDAVRPAVLRLPGSPGFDKQRALELYPEHNFMARYVHDDSERFLNAMDVVLGKRLSREPLVSVTSRYLDNPLSLSLAAQELGLSDLQGLAAVFRTPRFTGLGLMPLSGEGVIRRDAWEDYFDRVVRDLGLGRPLPPLDGITRRDFPAGAASYAVELKTNRKSNIFSPGDEMVLLVANTSPLPLYIELIGTSARGEMVILTSSDVIVRPGQVYRWPEHGSLKVRGNLGKESVTLYASPRRFTPGTLLRATLPAGQGMADRVVHDFFRLEQVEGRRVLVVPEAIVKRTIEIETR